jgi:hypothetical protein
MGHGYGRRPGHLNPTVVDASRSKRSRTASRPCQRDNALPCPTTESAARTCREAVSSWLGPLPRRWTRRDSRFERDTKYEAATFKCRRVDLPCMGNNGLGKKLVFAAAAVGAILLVLRIVGGRGGGADDEAGGDAIDRVDTGRSADDREEGTVETGLERVSTDDADDGTVAVDDGPTAGTGATADEDAAEGENEGDDEVPVEATGGRFDDLDLFDIVAIAGAAFEAGREEYRNRV